MGSPTPQIVWFKNDEMYTNNNIGQSELIFNELALENRGFYHCEARSTIDGEPFSVKSVEVVLSIQGIILLSINEYENMV